MQDDIESCHQEFVTIISSLKESLALRLESILENDVFKAISVILDSESYQFLESDIVYDEVKVVVDYFESHLLANNCNLNFLKEEFKILHDQVKRYVSKCLSEKCWSIIFRIGQELRIGNLLHIIEICLTILLSNAGSERVFSFLWHIFSKERQSLSHEKLEMLLHIWSDVDQSEEQYGGTVEMFLTEYLDGTIHKRKRYLEGHAYPQIRKSKKPSHNVVAILDSVIEEDAQDIRARPENLPLGQFSDDEWSSGNEF